MLYDGVCGVCNRTVRFILKRDPAGVFRFASLQSGLAQRILTRHGASPSDLDTLYVVTNFDPTLTSAKKQADAETLLARSEAVVFALGQLGALWRGVAATLRLLPRWLNDWSYVVIARNRYRIFGRYETCPVPSEDMRVRFLDL
jgi:predicted DCC family thiol-disulfide oxidoreductase YuxK